MQVSYDDGLSLKLEEVVLGAELQRSLSHNHQPWTNCERKHTREYVKNVHSAPVMKVVKHVLDQCGWKSGLEFLQQ